jgi:glucose/arabinose dehydrogenase
MRRTTRAWRGRLSVAAVLLAAAALAGPLESGSGAAATPSVALSPVGGTFSAPVYVASPPGNTHLVFVVEQNGRIEAVRDGQKLANPFLDVRDLVSTGGGEQGLLSMAFDPGYGSNRRFYVYYTNQDCTPGGACNIEVDSFLRSTASSVRASAASRRRVIEITHDQAPNHNGGQLQFGPDGDLYLAPGDGGTQGDPENDAQLKGRLLGKLLRIKPRANGGYDVPADNPYAGVAGRDEIYARGLRNPFRFSFDSANGDLWVADVGWSTWEEIDHATAAQAGGANFGWHVYEGPDPCAACGFAGGTPPPPDYVAPVHWYSHRNTDPEHGSVIIGGYVAHDPALPSALDGDYIYTDNAVGDLRAYDPGTDTMTGLGVTVSFPSSFGVDASDHLYVCSLGDGRVYRLVAP